MSWQREWAGSQIVNKGFLVCEDCLDKPNPQLKARLMPPDPVPISDPRPELAIFPMVVQRLGVNPPPGVIATEPAGAFPVNTPMEIEP